MEAMRWVEMLWGPCRKAQRAHFAPFREGQAMPPPRTSGLPLHPGSVACCLLHAPTWPRTRPVLPCRRAQRAEVPLDYVFGVGGFDLEKVEEEVGLGGLGAWEQPAEAAVQLPATQGGQLPPGLRRQRGWHAAGAAGRAAERQGLAGVWACKAGTISKHWDHSGRAPETAGR